MRAEGVDGIGAHGHGGWNVRQEPAIGPPESERPVGVTVHAIAMLVHCPMVSSTQQGQIRERRRAALGPVPHVMAFGHADPASWEATATISILQRAT